MTQPCLHMEPQTTGILQEGVPPGYVSMWVVAGTLENGTVVKRCELCEEVRIGAPLWEQHAEPSRDS